MEAKAIAEAPKIPYQYGILCREARDSFSGHFHVRGLFHERSSEKKEW